MLGVGPGDDEILSRVAVQAIERGPREFRGGADGHGAGPAVAWLFYGFVAWAVVLLVVPAGVEGHHAGSSVSVELLRGPDEIAGTIVAIVSAVFPTSPPPKGSPASRVRPTRSPAP